VQSGDKYLRSNEALNLGSLEVGLLAVLGDLTTNDILSNIIRFLQVEQFADLGSSLGAQAAGLGSVGKSGNLAFTLGDNNQVQDSQISTNDAAADGLALAHTRSALAEARMSSAKEEADASVAEDTLLHGKPLFIVSSGDAENVSLVLITQDISINLVRHAFIIESTTEIQMHRL
jgi:hypothetical protein